MKHATVTRDGFEVPLIGIPPVATLEVCDCCGGEFPIRDLELTGRQLLCQKCKTTKTNN